MGDFGSQSKDYTRQKSAHGIGSYKLTRALRGRLGTMFSSPSLLRSKEFFDKLLARSNGATKFFNRSSSPYSTLSEFVDYNFILAFFSSNSQHPADLSVETLSIRPVINKLSFISLIDFIDNYKLDPSQLSPVTDLYLKLLRKFNHSPEFKLISPFFKSLCLTLSMTQDELIDTYSLDVMSVKISTVDSYKTSLKNTIILSEKILSEFVDQ